MCHSQELEKGACVHLSQVCSPGNLSFSRKSHLLTEKDVVFVNSFLLIRYEGKLGGSRSVLFWT